MGFGGGGGGWGGGDGTDIIYGGGGIPVIGGGGGGTFGFHADVSAKVLADEEAKKKKKAEQQKTDAAGTISRLQAQLNTQQSRLGALGSGARSGTILTGFSGLSGSPDTAGKTLLGA
jgi:hypothetical protein